MKPNQYDLTPSMRAMLSLWQKIPRRAGQSDLPPRVRFDAQAALNDHYRMSVIKRMGADDLQAELVRLNVAQDWERPIAGLSVYDLAAPQMRPIIASFYEAVLTKPCAALMVEHVQERAGVKMPRSLATLMLPFADRDGKDTIVLGFTSSPRPGFQAALRHQILLAPEQVQGVSWLDLGHGVPDISFDLDAVAATTNHRAPKRAWWDRFIPQAAAGQVDHFALSDRQYGFPVSRARGNGRQGAVRPEELVF